MAKLRGIAREFIRKKAGFAELRAEAAKPTLEELGTPWAEAYRGGAQRLTGRLAAAPIRCQNGDVAPGWRWLGHLTENEFWGFFKAEEHFECHSSSRADWDCVHCQAAGWVD